MIISTMPDKILSIPRCIGTWQMVTIFQRNFQILIHSSFLRLNSYYLYISMSDMLGINFLLNGQHLFQLKHF